MKFPVLLLLCFAFAINVSAANDTVTVVVNEIPAPILEEFDHSKPPGDMNSGEAADAAREGAKLSADATLAATEKNIDFQKWLWGEQKELTQPWVTAGGAALDNYQSMMDTGFQYDQYTDPSTEFRRSEGEKAVSNSGAAGGMQLSGGQLKDLSRFNQDYASTEYGNAYSRWQNELNNQYNLSAMGQAQASGQAVQGGQMGGQVSSSILEGGRAQSQMYSDFGNINANQAMSGWNTVMDVAGLGASYYGGKG